MTIHQSGCFALHAGPNATDTSIILQNRNLNIEEPSVGVLRNQTLARNSNLALKAQKRKEFQVKKNKMNVDGADFSGTEPHTFHFKPICP